ncbi:Thioredoxin-related transmembrane protein 1-like [Oopsacas minuta]|uniref:Thioredoxin-related transmembrane protein 1-like n=1 Tax=Oopsacas minuta TaxID=111878 RepID=A0AAV7K7P7_9METZ|nr:Thioredoxin-related transmembrane protein 1-like [Oopsacas minuta]
MESLYILILLLTIANTYSQMQPKPESQISDPPPVLIQHCPVFNSDNISLAFEGEWLIEFFAPWCPACQGFTPIWEQVASYFDQPHKVTKIAKVDVTMEPLISSHFMVTALPTIFHIKNGEVRLCSTMKRSYTAIIQFIREDEWTDTPPVPYYFKPYSPIMSIFAYMIYFAMVTQEHAMRYAQGDPMNLAYLVGGMMTLCVCLGCGIGLFIYFCCGVSKYQQYVPKKIRDSTGQPQKTKVD